MAVTPMNCTNASGKIVLNFDGVDIYDADELVEDNDIQLFVAQGDTEQTFVFFRDKNGGEQGFVTGWRFVGSIYSQSYDNLWGALWARSICGLDAKEDIIDKVLWERYISKRKWHKVKITVNNGTYTGGANYVSDFGAVELTIIPDEGYELPATVYSGSFANTSYNPTSGKVVFSMPFNDHDDLYITVDCVPLQSYPVKGDIINIDMNGDGTDEQYLVLKTNGSVAEVFARAGIGNSMFSSRGQIYERNALDVYLNTTYYATLSETAKSAIVDKTFRQDSWYRNGDGNPIYNGSFSTAMAYQLSLGNASFGDEITRHVYALSVQDVIDYLEVTTDMTSANSTLNMTNVQSMFNITDGYVWLRSAYADDFFLEAMGVYGDYGDVAFNSVAYTVAARPAFQIDLSKIDWAYVNPPTPPTPTPDLTGTTWQINATPELPSGTSKVYSINFSSNGGSYDGFVLDPLDGDIVYMNFDSPTLAYHAGDGWISENLRTVAITDGTDATNATLIEWFENNATRVV